MILQIEAKLKEWAEKSPVAKWVDITDGNLTAMERPIYMMIVDDPSSGQIISAKQTVVLVAGNGPFLELRPSLDYLAPRRKLSLGVPYE